MTDEEELELEREALMLRKQKAQALAASPVSLTPSEPVTLGAGSTGAFHAGRHMAFGLGDKITAAVESLKDYSQDKTGKSFGDIYNRNLAFNDKLIEDSDKAHPTARWVGNGLGIAGNLAALAGVAPVRAGLAAEGLVSAAPKALPASTVLGRALQGATEGAKVGAPLGALGGYGADRSDNPLRSVLVNALGGALTGGVLGGIGGGIMGKLAQRQEPTPPIVTALKEVAKETNQPLPMVARGIKPDPEAQVLQKYGIPLTLGQMQPGGVASEAEEAAMRVPLLGKAIEAQRKAPEDVWRDVVINQSRAPVEGPFNNRGGAVDRVGTMDRLNQIQKDFNNAYGQVADRPAAALALHPDSGELVHPREAFTAILKDPSYQAGGDDLNIVRNVMKDELTKMERLQQAGQPINAGVLIDMRSGLRGAAQNARLQGNLSRAMMFQDAADSVGGGLRGTQLPRDVDFLNKTDAAYSRFMKVVGATQRAGRNIEEGEFGPKQLEAELQSAYGKKFATDPEAGDSLRELGRAGKYAFTPREPLTGHGEKLKSAFGLTLGAKVARANVDPATQKLFMLAAQRAAEMGPKLLPPTAGELEQAFAEMLGRAPITATGVNLGAGAIQDALTGRRR